MEYYHDSDIVLYQRHLKNNMFDNCLRAADFQLDNELMCAVDFHEIPFVNHLFIHDIRF